MATSNTRTVRLKLLIDSKSQKVLFAEAGKDFVDFLFTLLSLPVGTVIKLLSKDAMVGSLGKLYDSVETLDEEYLQPDLNRDIVLNPKEPVAAGPNILGLLTDAEPSDATKVKVFYTCSNYNHHHYVSEDPTSQCPSCHNAMSSQMTYVDSPTTTKKTNYSGAGKVGYVKGPVTYMILDDLEVKPVSSISSILLLKIFNVKDLGVLEEKVVDLNMDEGVKLLKASLQSKSVLTDVFLGDNIIKMEPPM